MVNAGRVAIVPQGEWSTDATYKRLDAVTHNNTLYFAKKEVPAGTATSNTEYWSKSIVGGAGAIATTEDAGIVKPDGTTITIDEDGTIHGQSEITVDGTTITLDEAKGIISLAKTLQDKINTIDDKLPSTSVINSNTTTEEGFALDARQANPNIAGTLAANILQLNNDSLLTTSFNYRGFVEQWASETQITGGVGVYKIGTISDEYWSEISQGITEFTNVGDYDLIIFHWNGAENYIRYGTGLLLTCRSSIPLFVTIWDRKFYLHRF